MGHGHLVRSIAANYLSAAQIYLLANPLLRTPLRPEHIKPRLLGHWGTCRIEPGYLKQESRDKLIDHKAWIRDHGEDLPEGLLADSTRAGVYRVTDSDRVPPMSSSARGGMEMNFAFGKPQKAPPSPSADRPLRLLVLGDLGGHASRGEVRPLDGLRPVRIDMDSLPAVLAKLQPRIQIGLGDQPPFGVPIQSMDDFHPDHLFASLDFFAPMRKLRQQIMDPKTMAVAAALLGAAAPAPAPTPAQISDHDADLARLLGRPSSQPVAAPAPQNANSVVENLIRQMVAPQVVKQADPRQAELLAKLDGMSGELMRAVLHDRGFQGVESAWRGLDRMLRALELYESVHVFVLDVSRDEIIEDLARASSVAESGLYQLLAAADKPWSFLVDLTPYGRTQEDAALLARLGTMAEGLRACLLAGHEWSAFSAGFTSPDAELAWTELRQLPAARHISLALPAILLRQPYGKATDPIEGFAFTEQSDPPALSRFSWGSSSLAVAQLLVQSFIGADGWDFEPGDHSIIEDLPIFVSKVDGESVQIPCAQAWLSEPKIDALIKQGLMPLVSAQGSGEVRVPRFQSLAFPASGLAGPW